MVAYQAFFGTHYTLTFFFPDRDASLLSSHIKLLEFVRSMKPPSLASLFHMFFNHHINSPFAIITTYNYITI